MKMEIMKRMEKRGFGNCAMIIRSSFRQNLFREQDLAKSPQKIWLLISLIRQETHHHDREDDHLPSPLFLGIIPADDDRSKKTCPYLYLGSFSCRCCSFWWSSSDHQDLFCVLYYLVLMIRSLLEEEPLYLLSFLLGWSWCPKMLREMLQILLRMMFCAESERRSKWWWSSSEPEICEPTQDRIFIFPFCVGGKSHHQLVDYYQDYHFHVHLSS